MAIAELDQIIDDVKSVLPIYEGTDLYNTELKVFVLGAISKLENEGVKNIFEYDSNEYYDYITCLRYQVGCDMDLDIDIERLREQYITRVNTLRCSLKAKQN